MIAATQCSPLLAAVVAGDIPLETPAFIYDEAVLGRLLARVAGIRERSGCRALFAVKSFCFRDALAMMAPGLDGFAVSSLFEARLARSVLASSGLASSGLASSGLASSGLASSGPGDGGAVHFTAPGIRPGEAAELGRLCDYVAFNSAGQWRAHRDALRRPAGGGLRVNPELSLIGDPRYDPCRPDSRLGEPPETVAQILDGPESELVAGLLLHTNCDATDFGQLEATVNRLRRRLGHRLHDGRLRWINLGGGYLFEDADATALAPLYRTLDFLREGCGLETIIEPGAALVRSAGCLVATALELQERDGRRTAILDTTVNHLPEVFEYQYEPDVLGHRDDAPWAVTLAGCTCLAGDVFGEYRFDRPLAVGERVAFPNAGAYTLVKAHTFNGVNLPTIYALTAEGELQLKRRYTYAEFAARWGAGDGQ